jgi:hypothetical protein
MVKYLKVFLVFFLMQSCQKTNDYYSDINNSNNQKITIKGIKGLDFSVSALKTGKSLVISSYLILSDETLQLEDFNIQITGKKKPISIKKECYMINEGETLSFEKFKEVKNHINETQKKCIIYYEIEDSQILSLDDLNFKVFIKSNLGTLNKQVVMKKHSRYRLFLEGG